MRLNELASSIETVSVVIRGRTVVVRPLPAKFSRRLYEAFPEPAPPLRPDPSRGSLAPPIPDESDPEHQRRARAYYQRVAMASIVAAARLDVARSGDNCAAQDGVWESPYALGDDDLRRWMIDAEEGLTSAMTMREINALNDALARVSGGSGAMEVRALELSASTPSTPSG